MVQASLSCNLTPARHVRTWLSICISSSSTSISQPLRPPTLVSGFPHLQFCGSTSHSLLLVRVFLSPSLLICALFAFSITLAPGLKTLLYRHSLQDLSSHTSRVHQETIVFHSVEAHSTLLIIVPDCLQSLRPLERVRPWCFSARTIARSNELSWDYEFVASFTIRLRTPPRSVHGELSRHL